RYWGVWLYGVNLEFIKPRLGGAGQTPAPPILEGSMYVKRSSTKAHHIFSAWNERYQPCNELISS
ncbi:MAG: hypothetical protein ACK59W_10415, partial [Pseudanabaena sp.]